MATLAAFVVLAALVAVRALDGLDRVVLDLFQRPHAGWLDLASSVVTILGQTEVVGSVALGVAIVRLRARRRDWWIPLLLVLVIAIELLGKFLVPQPLPPSELARSIDLIPFVHAPTAYAFPSGHVARLAFLAAALRWPSSLGASLVFAMAITRVYLAEHWPSDVVGGWLLGHAIAHLRS